MTTGSSFAYAGCPMPQQFPKDSHWLIAKLQQVCDFQQEGLGRVFLWVGEMDGHLLPQEGEASRQILEVELCYSEFNVGCENSNGYRFGPMSGRLHQPVETVYRSLGGQTHDCFRGETSVAGARVDVVVSSIRKLVVPTPQEWVDVECRRSWWFCWFGGVDGGACALDRLVGVPDFTGHNIGFPKITKICYFWLRPLKNCRRI